MGLALDRRHGLSPVGSSSGGGRWRSAGVATAPLKSVLSPLSEAALKRKAAEVMAVANWLDEAAAIAVLLQANYDVVAAVNLASQQKAVDEKSAVAIASRRR